MNLHLPSIAVPANEARNVLGTQVASLYRRQALALLGDIVRHGQFTRLAFLNAHNANIACEDPEFVRALDRFLVLPDGIGVDIASRVLYGNAFAANLNGTDFIPQFLQSMEYPVTVALVGARAENAKAARDRLEAIAPWHRFVFIQDGYFDSSQEQNALDELERLKPQILLVAMGVPRQEFWISSRITADHCTLAIGVGALFDFLSGQVSRAPGWMRSMRVEWLYRLALEPGRLWRRYVIGNPVFLIRVLRQKLKGGDGRA